MAIPGSIVLLIAAQSTLAQIPAVWSTSTEPVAWSSSAPFPFAWYRDQSAIVLVDDQGIETGRWSIDAAIRDPGLRLLALTGNDAGTLFAVWTRRFDPTLSKMQLAALKAKGADRTRLILLNAEGDPLHQTTSHIRSPRVLFSGDRFLIYWRWSHEFSPGTIPKIHDARGELTAELPDAAYWDIQAVGEPVNAIYTWSFPGDFCEGCVIGDVGGMPDVGTLTKWDWNGKKQWAVDVKRDGRNPAEFAAAPDGHVVLRYGQRRATRALVSLDGANGRVVAERQVSDKMTLARDRALFLARPAHGSGHATVSVLDSMTLKDTPFSTLPENQVTQQLKGPTPEADVVFASQSAPTEAGEGRWYALGRGAEPTFLGNGSARVSGSWLLWSDGHGSKIVRPGDLFGDAR